MKKLYTAVFLSFAIGSCYAQLFTVSEVVDSKAEAIGKLNVIDINGSLEVKLNTSEILLQIPYDNASDKLLVAKVKELNFILSNQIELLNLLEGRVIDRTAESQLDEYTQLMTDFYQKVMAHPEIRKTANKLLQDFFSPSADKTVYTTPQAYMLTNLNIEYEKMITELNQDGTASKAKIYLTAFLTTKNEQNRKVHIENFDTYTEGEFFEVERWVTTFSKDDIDEFKKTKILADNLNEIVNQKFLYVKNFLDTNLKSIGCIQKLLEELQSLIDDKDSIFLDEAKTVKVFLESFKSDLLGASGPLNSLANAPAQSDVTALDIFNARSNAAVAALEILPVKAEVFFKNLKTDILNKPRIQTLQQQFNTCKGTISDDVNKIKNLASNVSSLLQAFKNSSESASDIGDEVMQFNINELPGVGFINLKTTGKRENGSELLFKLHFSKDGTPKSRITLEEKRYKLRQLGFYTMANVSVILANPFNEGNNVTLEKEFQFAPSGSLVFKFGSRNSKTWDFIDPGFGFNVSTPDFDLDGSPDIGLGGVITVIRDIVSAGVAYNTNTDTPYWFFGLSLPFSTLGLFNSSATISE